MSTAIIQETVRAFRKKRIEPQWEKLDLPDESLYVSLWAGLQELGVTSFSLPEGLGGIPLDVPGRFEILGGLGAAAPALAFGLIGHVAAVQSVASAAGGTLPGPLAATLETKRLALAGSPLDAAPETNFTLSGARALSGAQRVGLPYPEAIVVPALEGDQLQLCVVGSSATGLRFEPGLSSHGLRFVPFGMLTLDGVTPDYVFAWPASGAAANQADGLLTAALTGMTDELAERAMSYAKERYQGGKMISEHDAVQQLVGPIELARRALESLALSTLAAERAGDGGSSAFAVDIVRRSGLDAIQAFGGYGYMEDYRVERYLRDANTFETAWVHAAARVRGVAKNRACNAVGRG